jgi:hypothetical protein
LTSADPIIRAPVVAPEPVLFFCARSPLLARSRHANEHCECLLSGTLRKSRFGVVRTVVDPISDIEVVRGLPAFRRAQTAEMVTPGGPPYGVLRRTRPDPPLAERVPNL